MNDINEKSIQKNSRSTASATSAARGAGTVLHGRGRPGMQEMVQHRERELPHHLSTRAGLSCAGLCTGDGTLQEACGAHERLPAGGMHTREDAGGAARIQFCVKWFRGVGAEKNGCLHDAAGLWCGGNSLAGTVGGARVAAHQSDAVRAESRAEAFRLVLRRDVERAHGRTLHGELAAGGGRGRCRDGTDALRTRTQGRFSELLHGLLRPRRPA